MDLVKNIGRIDHHHIFLGLWAARGVVSVRSTKAKAWLDGLLTLPLVLPPTVAGFFCFICLEQKDRPVSF